MYAKEHQRSRPAWSVVAACGLVLLVGHQWGDRDDWSVAEAATGQLHRLDDIMRDKLEHGEQLLGAVVLGNHESVERHAHELTLLSEASTWTPLRTVDYLRYAAVFRDSATRLAEAAREQDTEQMSAAYFELVTTCVQCHRHVRGAARAD